MLDILLKVWITFFQYKNQIIYLVSISIVYSIILYTYLQYIVGILSLYIILIYICIYIYKYIMVIDYELRWI